MTIKAREGDLIENSKRVIFDVKGLVHPTDRIVAFPRFIPYFSGNRKRGNASYRKIYALSERFKFLEQNFPHYLVHDPFFDETLCEVPVSEVKKHYKPVERIQELRSTKSLDPLETKAMRFAELLKETARIPWNAMGTSGSILVRLYTSNSDVDPIVYGTENCRRIYSTLKQLLEENGISFKAYDREDLRALFDFRSKDTAVGFEDFVRTESRKVMQGKFMGTDYFMRFVKDWSEIDEKYGDVQYKNVGYAKIKATVVDDSESIFTPCRYSVGNVTVIEGTKLQPILEIASFRGRFCEQARAGEVVVAQGKVEHIIEKKHGREHFRLLLGNKLSDFMILAQAKPRV